MLRDYDTLEELARTPWTVLVRAERRRDKLPVLIKATLASAPTRAEVEAFEREFEILHRVRGHGLPAAHELVRTGPRRALVLSDPGGVLLPAVPAHRREGTAWCLRIGIELLSVLGDLHEQGLVCGSLTPASVLVDGRQRVSLVDFSGAGTSEMPPPAMSLTTRDRLALPYLSPEQTGRMNRGVDHRTDLYSFGVILYELLTGAPPFVSDDPLELIHWHVARVPDPPQGLDPRVSHPLSAVVSKLLAKTSEERYQTAGGARQDLLACLEGLEDPHRLAGFVAGSRDTSDRFLISEKLYGRDHELRELVQTLDSVTAGASSLVLIGGPSGVGKTVLIRELYRPLVRARGYFTGGKFDQVARNVPFGGLIQACGGLLRQLLAEPDDRLADWRLRLSSSLGHGASVLAGVIPEIELLLGPQPSPPALDGVEALNRFHRAFVHFLAALAGNGRPLVVFLDDLQWADAATLGLLQHVLSSREVGHLLIVGAYRHHEVGPGHLLLQATAELESVGVRPLRMTLGPLGIDDVTSLLSDTLRLPAFEVSALARVVHATTAGNPFFVIQFLETLHRDHLVWFDATAGRWRFALDAVADAATTDDVVALLTQRIQRLNARTQRTLMYAGVLGARFSGATVAIVSATSLAEIHSDLREAVGEGLVVPLEDTYRFLHDRVQQAAIELVPAESRAAMHLTVGRRLREWWDAAAEPERIFDVVGHMNAGHALIDDRGERTALARLNLEAGRRARGSTAWDAAATYFDVGAELVGAVGWIEQYDLAFALHLDAAECHFLARHFEVADDHVARCLAQARTAMDAAQVHALRMAVHENRSEYELAVASGREALTLLGVSLPDAAGAPAALEDEIAAIEGLRADRPITRLVDLPVMVEPSTQLAMRILTSLWSSAYISGRQLVARLISATLVRLSLTLGNTEDSAYGYVTHAITIGPERGDYEAAYEWGRLALAVNERFDDRRRRAKIYQQFHAHVCLWRRPLAECVTYAREATRSGLESGDLIYAGYGAVTEAWAALPIANDLDQFVRDYEPALALLDRLHLDDFRSAHRVILGWALALQGRTAAPTSLTHGSFDEQAYLQRFGGEVFFRTFYYTAKLQLHVLNGDVADGVATCHELGRGTLAGTIWPVLVDFWGGLALTAAFSSAAPEEQARSWARCLQARESLRVLAENAPENYRGFWLLLSAEMARVSLRFAEARELAVAAVEHAAGIANLQQQALANEVSARIVAQHEGDEAARPFVLEAIQCYRRWGAAIKAAAMEARHGVVVPDMSASRLGERPDRAAAVVDSVALDMSTVVKISQALAMEVRLADLLPKLMRIAIENAGAQRGVFVQDSNGSLVIEAEGRVDREDVHALERIPIEDGTHLATSVVQYVRHTGASVVVGDALQDERFGTDPYVQARRPRSILSVPVVHQGRMRGILYLEHGAPGIFNAERVSLMHLVSAQAAIALENAALYREATEEAAQRIRAEEMLREVTEGTATALGEGFFTSLVRHLASALRVRYAFVTECREARTRARSLAFWMGDHIADNFEYAVANTPCKRVFEGRVCAYPSDVQRAFPEDVDLARLNAQSYLGAPMVDASGQVIGHIAVLDERPMEDDVRASAVLSIFSARAGAELERLRAEQALRAALREVETLKNRLQDENVYLQDEIRGEHNFEDMVGHSPALLAVLRQVERVAATDATVLILGETGTGKELIARALHSRSARSRRPLVKVNCGAISSGLVESELFGHVRGAFTGAIDRRVGRFELADGGTIFLDEVGELPMDAQVKLLRVLQEQEFEPVGSSRTVRVNVRVIAATNRDLEQSVADGRFRADLYFRLNVVSLRMPPLRERQADVPLLVTFFVARFAKQFGKRVDAVSSDTMRLLTQYRWPGNIRELQNVIERAVVLCEGSVLSLGPDLLPRSPTAAEGAGIQLETGGEGAMTLEETERRHIVAVLERVNYVIEGPSGAAQILSLHPNTLRSRMKKLGVTRPPAAGGSR